MSRVRMGDARLQRITIQSALQLRRALWREGGSAARVFDRAHRRVLAEERALRAAQYLDSLQVGEILIRHADVAEEHVIDDHADRRLHVVVAARLADAAQGHAGATRVRRRGGEARRALREIGHGEHGFPGEAVAAENGNWNRHILRTLGTIACGDHYFVERVLVVLGSGFLRIRLCRTQQGNTCEGS